MKATLSLLTVVLLCATTHGKPLQAPRPLQAPSLPISSCGNSVCDCGCRETGVCDCLRTNHATEDKELSKPYAADWKARGWIYDPLQGYWWKPAPMSQPYPIYQPSTTPGITSYQHYAPTSNSTINQPYLSQRTYAPYVSPSYPPQSYAPSFQSFGGVGGYSRGFFSGGSSRGGC